MTNRELLKEARDLIVMCSLLDKSGQCKDMVDKIDKQLSIANVVGRSEQAGVCMHNLDMNGKCFKCGEQYIRKES